MNILKNKWLQQLLLPLSFLYNIATFFRNKFYDWQIFCSYKIPDCKVISIGNITVGGTGKTPAVEFLAKYIISRGKKAAVLSRGYHRESKGTLLVTDGQNIFVNSRKSGDEPYLLAKCLSNTPVVVESDRYKGGIFIKKEFDPDYLILDDAFQHRRIQRNIDIVLIDCMTGFGNRLALPGGILRESLKGLKRADMIWLTRVDQADEIGSLLSSLKKYTNAPIIKTIHQPQALHLISTNKLFSTESLKGKKVFIFSGIGNPHAFRDTIARLKADIKGELLFIDHYKYNKSDLLKIFTNAQQSNAEWIITTEKDAIRIIDLPEMKTPIFYLKIELAIIEGMNQIEMIINV